jgi:hypothetical protein
MISRLPACRNKAQADNCIWISDEILSTTFERFAARKPTRQGLGCRRHGSSVPGPLEARRRLAKRKMMSLSTPGATGSHPPDWSLEALWAQERAEKAQKEIGKFKWQAPFPRQADAKPERKANNQKKALPSWLENWKPSNDEENTIGSVGFRIDLCLNNDTKTMKSENSLLDEFIHLLSTATNGRQIRQVIDSNKELLKRSSTQYGEAVFNRLFAIGVSYRDLIEFYRYPQLNSSNHRRFRITLEHFRTQIHTSDSYFSFLDLTKQLLTSGLVSNKDLHTLLQVMPRIIDKLFGVNGEIASIAFHRLVWDSVRACPTFGLRDIKPVTITKWFRALHQLKPTEDVGSLLSDMVRSISQAQLAHLKGYVHSLLETIVRQFGLGKEIRLFREEVSIEEQWSALSVMVARAYKLGLVEEYHVRGLQLLELRTISVDGGSKNLIKMLLASTSVASQSILFKSATCGNRVPQQFEDSLFEASALRAENWRIANLHKHNLRPYGIFQLLRLPSATYQSTAEKMGRRSMPNPDHIHILATHFAETSTTSDRQSFRQVHKCYLLLRSYGLEVQPSMVRALAKSGIMRPLEAGHEVSNDRLQYIIGIVAKIEGLETAQALDEGIWYLRVRMRKQKWRSETRQSMTSRPRHRVHEVLHEQNITEATNGLLE